MHDTRSDERWDDVRRRRLHAWTLRAAGVYNLAWGGVVVALPNLLFDWAGMHRPRYPELWQCIGMIVGVYGIGYWIAARDPVRHWPIVLVGLLGKVFGPVGFAIALARGTFAPAFSLIIATNDLAWWIPFASILLHAHRCAASSLVDQRHDRVRQAVEGGLPRADA